LRRNKRFQEIEKVFSINKLQKLNGLGEGIL
jgi:hypothetical protein